MSERDGRPGVPPLKPSEGSEKGTTSSRESKYRAHEARQAISSTGASQVGPLALQPSAARDQSVPGSSAVQAAPLTSSNFARSGALEGPKSGLAEQGVSVPVPQQPSLWPSGAAARSVSPPPSTIQTPTNFDISVRRPRPQNPTLPTGRTSASSDSLMHNLTVGRLQPSRALLAEAQKLHPCSPGATSGLSGPQSSKAGRLGVVQPETRPSLPPRRTAPARQENPAAQDSPASWARPAPQEEAGPSLGAGKPRETNYNPTKGALPNLTPKQHRLESKTESGVSEASDRGAASVDGEQAYSSAIAPITASHAHEPSQTQQRTAAKRTVAGANKPRSIPFRPGSVHPAAISEAAGISQPERRRKPYDSKTRALALELINDGDLNNDAIAIATGAHKSTVSRWKREARDGKALIPNRGLHKWDEATYAQVMGYIDNDMFVPEISRRTGVAAPTIYKWRSAAKQGKGREVRRECE